MSGKNEIIKLSGVYKSYFLSNGEEIPVLKGIDMKVYENEFVALMGESGSGKSTLLNILGFLHHVDKGEYFFQGENLADLKEDDILSYIRNRKIGFIFQQFHLFSRMSVLENVSLSGIYAGLDKYERIERAKKYIDKVGLSDRIDHKPSELSGGQQQRVSIARALVNEPELIFADEPTGALDGDTTKEIMDMIMSLKETGKTIIMVTHDRNVASFADRIIFLKDGKIENCNYKLIN